MAQIDRFLSVLVSNKATSLIMTEGDLATLMIKDSPRTVMKQPLTSAQILTLVREIAPPNSPHNLNAKGGVRFTYSSGDGTFDVSLSQADDKLSARVEPSNGSSPAAPPAEVASIPGYESHSHNGSSPHEDAPPA